MVSNCDPFLHGHVSCPILLEAATWIDWWPTKLTKENNAACQQLIIDHHRWMGTFAGDSPAPCIFHDVLDQVPKCCDLTQGSFSEKKRKISKVTLNSSQHCLTHNAECNLEAEVDIDFSGLPCPDYSKANKKRKFEEGPSGKASWLPKSCLEPNEFHFSYISLNNS